MIKQIIAEATNIEEEPTIKETAVDKVKDYIKKRIVLGSLKSGDKIPTENELCQILDVSRGSVREAMKILEALSIIKIIRGDGTYIAQVDDIRTMESTLLKIILSDTTINELTEFREEIEFAVLNLASKNVTEEELTILEQIVQETRDCTQIEPTDTLRLYELDNKFHDLLGKATHNLIIQEVYKFTHEIIAPMLLKNYQLGQPGAWTVESHEITLEAIRTRDFHLMGLVVKRINEIWMKSHYGKRKESSLLDRDILNSLVLGQNHK